VVFEIFSHPDNAGAFRDIQKVGYRKVSKSSFVCCFSSFGAQRRGEGFAHLGSFASREWWWEGRGVGQRRLCSLGFL
jgi:hypothetical protein